jgi:hypothetical protein
MIHEFGGNRTTGIFSGRRLVLTVECGANAGRLLGDLAGVTVPRWNLASAAVERDALSSG